jgi:MarR family transcriptional regulator, organic hydroperoxide resistance regulator
VANTTGGGFGYALMHAAQAWRTEAGSALAAHELTVPQFLVMMALYRRHRHHWAPLTQADVSTQLGMDANTTSQIARALEARGLLRREPHPFDARARALTLTELGLARSREASATARVVNDVFFSVITPEQQDSLGVLLHTLSTESEQRS